MNWVPSRPFWGSVLKTQSREVPTYSIVRTPSRTEELRLGNKANKPRLLSHTSDKRDATRGLVHLYVVRAGPSLEDEDPLGAAFT